MASRLRTLRVARHDVSVFSMRRISGIPAGSANSSTSDHPGGSLSGPGCGPDHSPGAAGLQAQGPGRRCPHGWTQAL
eukprot:107321-Hanusia_phi.AAC.1